MPAPRGVNSYFALLNQKARSFVERHRGEVRIRSYFIDGFDPDEPCRAMRRFARNADAVVFMAIDHPKVRQAVDELAASGKKMITLISEISSARRHAFIGIDSYAAGTAALLLGRFIAPRPGRVALIAASRIYRAHLEGEVGLLGLPEERFPRLSVIGTPRGARQPRGELPPRPQPAVGASGHPRRLQRRRLLRRHRLRSDRDWPRRRGRLHRPRPHPRHAGTARERHAGRGHHAGSRRSGQRGSEGGAVHV